MEFYIGQIFLGGWNFAPRGSTFAEGQLLAINSNTALFSLYGTTYGGDGRTSFGLPDLRGRAAIGHGNGPGLASHPLGQKSGNENTTLVAGNLPSHTHTLSGTNTLGDQRTPGGNSLAGDQSGDKIYLNAAPSVAMHSGSIGNTGTNQPFSNLSPYLALSYCVALVGIFPSRS